jgi:hypothetical protein
MINQSAPDVPEKAGPPHSVDLENILDWDVYLKDPPVRPRGEVKVRVEFLGRDRPLPVLDPEDEAA